MLRTKAVLALLAFASVLDLGCATSESDPVDARDPTEKASPGTPLPAPQQPVDPAPLPDPDRPAPPPPPPPTPAVDPQKACEDMAREVGQTGERECNFPSAGGEQEFRDQFANGSCANVKSLRDAKVLYDLCIPFLKAQSCADWTAGKSDPSCDGQLVL